MTDVPAGLTDVPAAWLTAAFLADLRRSDALKAATAAADTLLTEARQAQARAVEGLASGVNLSASMKLLLRASSGVLAAEAARQAVPNAGSDPIHAQAPLAAAMEALEATARGLIVTPLASDVAMDAWRKASQRGGRLTDPPIVTDMDREMSPLVKDVVARCNTWLENRRNWVASRALPGVNPVDLLRSASEQISQAAGLLTAVSNLNALTSQVNSGRRPQLLVGAGLR